MDNGALNSCEPGQTTAGATAAVVAVAAAAPLYGANRTALVFGGQNPTEFTSTLRAPFSQLIDPNYPTDMLQHPSTVTGDLTGCGARGKFDPTCFGLGDQTIPSSAVATQSVQFIPFVSPQV